MARKTIRIIASIEILIGVFTLFGLIISIILSLSKKSPNVFIFVLVSAVVSSAIGIGLFSYKEWARALLVFFSGYVILTKILVFTNLLYFNGEIITAIPASFKNCISILYHGFIMVFFIQQTTKNHFIKK